MVGRCNQNLKVSSASARSFSHSRKLCRMDRSVIASTVLAASHVQIELHLLVTNKHYYATTLLRGEGM